MFTALAEFFYPFYQKSYFATNPPNHKERQFSKSQQNLGQGSRYQAKSSPETVLMPKKKRGKWKTFPRC